MYSNVVIGLTEHNWSYMSSHPSGLSSLLASSPLLSIYRHPWFNISIPIIFVLPFLSLGCPYTGTKSEGQICLCDMTTCVCSTLIYSSLAALYICMSLCPDRYSASSLRRCSSVSGQPCDITLQQTIRTLCPTDVLPMARRGSGLMVTQQC